MPAGNDSETRPQQSSVRLVTVPLGQLEGFTVGVTADRRWEQQAELLERRGARVVHGPTIRTDYLAAEDTVREATLRVLRRPPDVFVATTGIGVRAWFEAAQAWGLGGELQAALAASRLVARGPKAAAALEANGLAGVRRVASETMDEVVAVVRGVLAGAAPDPVVAIQEYGTRSGPAVTGAISDAGAEILSVPVYRWRLPEDPDPAFRLIEAVAAADLDAVTFTSAPAVRNLFELADAADLADEVRAAFNGGSVVAACVGPVCASGAREEGIDTPVAPDVGRLGLLVRVVGQALSARRVVLGDVVVQGAAVERGGQAVLLTGRERAVLSVLAEASGATVAKAALARGVWRAPSSDPDVHVVEVTVGRLRRKLAPLGVSVVTVARRGYRLAW